jgi:hypothetical protein
LQEWCLRNQFDLIKNPIEDVFRIGDHEFERFEEIEDLGAYLDSRIMVLNHIKTIIAKSAKMLGFIKRILKEFKYSYTLKTLFVSPVTLL